MKERFNVVRHTITNAVEETLIVTRQLGANELMWLRNNGIETFDCIEFDLETGELKLAVSVIDINVNQKKREN